MMSDIGIPGIPFGSAAPKTNMPFDIVTEGQARAVTESIERDFEKREREAIESVSADQALRAERERSWIDFYDGMAKVERARGNRKFVRNFAIGAGVTIVGIIVGEALIANAGSR